MPAEFDAFASRYDEDLDRGLALTGEDKHYFAVERARITRHAMAREGVVPNAVLDYGCGTGTAIPLIAAEWGAERITGVDPSRRSLEVARHAITTTGADFVALDEYRPAGDRDVAFTNGVFHHIPVAERLEAARLMARSVRPGGLIAFWENNPWNPGTRWVMRRVAFDRDAIMISPPAARRLLAEAGLVVRSTTYHFIFPRFLGWLRGLEPFLVHLPLGGQYLVIARRNG